SLPKYGIIFPWRSLEEFKIDVFDAWKISQRKYSSQFFSLKNSSLPLSKENWEFKSTKQNWKGGKRGNQIIILGMEKNLKGWGDELGLTRERSRQLHNSGK